MNSSLSRAPFGISSKSRLFRAGNMTRVRPAAAAATTFSLMPPTGSTRPRSEISPVMAVLLLTVRSVSREARAVNIATPALGPSFGVAPAGTWTWMSLFSNTEGSIPSWDARLFTSVRAFEPPLWQFEAQNSGVAEFRRQNAVSADHECSLVYHGFDFIGIDAWQSNQDQNLTVSLQHIDRRFPAWFARSGPWLQRQELLVQALGAGKRLDGIGQHPVDGVFGRHSSLPSHEIPGNDQIRTFLQELVRR